MIGSVIESTADLNLSVYYKMKKIMMQFQHIVEILSFILKYTNKK